MQVCDSKIKRIYTIGYQGKRISEFVDQLKSNDVHLLVDSRIHAGGRKLDFCKKNLSKSLEENGIKYVHYKELGTPKYLMDIMKSEGSYSMDEYAKHLESNPEILNKVIKEISEESIAIMCFEKDYRECHRTVVADRISRKVSGSIVDHI